MAHIMTTEEKERIKKITRFFRVKDLSKDNSSETDQKSTGKFISRLNIFYDGGDIIQFTDGRLENDLLMSSNINTHNNYLTRLIEQATVYDYLFTCN